VTSIITNNIGHRGLGSWTKYRYPWRRHKTKYWLQWRKEFQTKIDHRNTKNLTKYIYNSPLLLQTASATSFETLQCKLLHQSFYTSSSYLFHHLNIYSQFLSYVVQLQFLLNELGGNQQSCKSYEEYQFAGIVREVAIRHKITWSKNYSWDLFRYV